MFRIITQDNCKYCTEAKKLLRDLDEEFVEYNLFYFPQTKEMLKSLGRNTVPQIWKDVTYIGGYEDLVKYLDH